MEPLLTYDSPSSGPVEPESADAKSKDRKSKPARGTASERQAAEIGEALHEKMVTIFGMLAGVAPVTSVYAVQNSEKAVTALVNIGKRNPKILALLAKSANGIDALEIGRFVLGLLVCIQVDTRRINGDELPARAFGVTEILEEHFWEQPEPTVNETVLLQQVPRFAGV